MDAILQECQVKLTNMLSEGESLLAKSVRTPAEETRMGELVEQMKGVQAKINDRKKALEGTDSFRKSMDEYKRFLDTPVVPSGIDAKAFESSNHKGTGEFVGQHVGFANGNRTALHSYKGGYGVPMHKYDPDEPLRHKGYSFTDFILCITNVAKGSGRLAYDAEKRLDTVYKSQKNVRPQETSYEEKTLWGGSGPAGGYTMPVGFYAQLMQVAVEASIIRSMATIIPMDYNEVEIPVLEQSTVVSGGTATLGGMLMRWSKVLSAKTETEPVFGQLTLIAHELSGITRVSRSTLRNSPISMESILFNLFGKAVAWAEDYAFMFGSGAGEPLGFANAPCTVTTSARSSASALTIADMAMVWTTVIADMRARGFWLASQGPSGAESKIIGMTGSANQVFIANAFVSTQSGGSVQAALNNMVFGRPVTISEKLPAFNTVNDIMYACPEAYLIGDHETIEIAVSEHANFTTNEIAYRVIKRTAGQPWLRKGVPLAGQTGTLVSPFVKLGAA